MSNSSSLILVMIFTLPVALPGVIFYTANPVVTFAGMCINVTRDMLSCNTLAVASFNTVLHWKLRIHFWEPLNFRFPEYQFVAAAAPAPQLSAQSEASCRAATPSRTMHTSARQYPSVFNVLAHFLARWLRSLPLLRCHWEALPLL